MKLYILRHGEAAERDGKRYPNDDDRPLVAKGRNQVKHLARCLRDWGVSCDVILSSPLVRARETAELVTAALGKKQKLEFTAQLSPRGDPSVLVQQLNKRRPAPKSIMLVGHEPYLSKLISLLTADARLAIKLKKGGLCRMDVDGPLRFGPCARLEWLLPPSLIE